MQCRQDKHSPHQSGWIVTGCGSQMLFLRDCHICFPALCQRVRAQPQACGAPCWLKARAHFVTLHRTKHCRHFTLLLTFYMNLIIICLDSVCYRAETVCYRCSRSLCLPPHPPSPALLFSESVSGCKAPLSVHKASSISSAGISDEHGQEIKSPLQLKNGQSIWLSYG